MGVATLSDLIGSLLSPDNVTALAAMTMTEIASTACKTPSTLFNKSRKYNLLVESASLDLHK